MTALRKGEAVDLLSFHLRASGIEHERERRFHQTRKWRFDICIPSAMLAIEVDGGTFRGGAGGGTAIGGHNSASGIRRDREKDEAALLLGWRVYRILPEWVKSGRALQTIEELIGSKPV